MRARRRSGSIALNRRPRAAMPRGLAGIPSRRHCSRGGEQHHAGLLQQDRRSPEQPNQGRQHATRLVLIDRIKSVANVFAADGAGQNDPFKVSVSAEVACNAFGLRESSSLLLSQVERNHHRGSPTRRHWKFAVCKAACQWLLFFHCCGHDPASDAPSTSSFGCDANCLIQISRF